MFVGRESELAELERRWAGDRFEFGVVYGTRRIGKTTMLQEFIKGKKAFYFQARKADEKDNLSAFSREYRRFRGMDEHVRYESFSDAFESIASDASSGRMVLIIDEIAYLCQKNQSPLSLLQFFVDGVFRQARLMLILSGSNVSFMEEILNNRNDPLYQRATFQIHLEKMPFLRDENHEKAWLLRVAANLSLNRIKYNKIRETSELSEELVQDGRQDLSFVWEAVRKLPLHYRDAVHLYYQEGCSTKEISYILKRNESTIRSDLKRGREQLERVLREEYGMEGGI